MLFRIVWGPNFGCSTQSPKHHEARESTEASRCVYRVPGQVSFPGGHIEPYESAIEAALRETREELSLQIGPIHVLGTCQRLPAGAMRGVQVDDLGLRRVLLPSAIACLTQ